jgi:uncharacterized protein DUF3293
MSEADTNPENGPDWVEIYQASRYAFPWLGGWREFALNGEDGPMADLVESVTLLTAWNPDSVECPQAQNQAANRRLERDLLDSGVDFSQAWGASLPEAESSWKEDGFAVFGWDRLQAAQWGLDWHQTAVVYLDPESVELLFCKEGYAVSCGLRRYA